MTEAFVSQKQIFCFILVNSGTFKEFMRSWLRLFGTARNMPCIFKALFAV